MKEWFCGTSAFDVKFGKNLDFFAILGKICISDAKTDSFIPFGADLFVYSNHMGIQIIRKITGKIYM